MNYFPIFSAILCFSLVSCNAQNTDPEPASTTAAAPVQGSKTASIKLHIVSDKLRVRKAPNTKATILTQLAKNQQVDWSGEVSSNHDKITLKGITFKTPWVKIKTQTQQEGWIYAAAAKSEAVFNPLSEQFIMLRSRSFFGTDLANKTAQYRQDYFSAQTAQHVSKVYQYGQKLREKIVKVLEQKSSLQSPNELIMTWLENMMSGYHLSLVAEGTEYYLFANFNKMLAIAQKTRGNDDDAFFKLSRDLYAYEGREGFYYAWMEQTWDYGGDSLLGQGKHVLFLKRLTQFSNNQSLFKAAIQQYTRALVQDISDNKSSEMRRFRESNAKRAEELAAILELNSPLLTSHDKIAIEKHRKILLP